MHLIQNQVDLTKIVQLLKESKTNFVSLDTEFVRQTTFWPELCLLQIFIDNECFVVDCLSLQVHMLPLCEALYHEKKTWVLHACKQDLEIFFHLTKKLPTPIFDTQIAAIFLKDGESISYDTLVQKYLGHTLDKSLQHTNWAKRPLSYEMLTYAAQDVIYLAEIYPILREALSTEGRLSWALDEMKALSNPVQFSEISLNRLRRLGIAKRLYPLAKEIFAFRDRCAAQLNLNRGGIFHDSLIEELCKAKNKEKVLHLVKKNAKILEAHAMTEALVDVWEKVLDEDTPPPSQPTAFQEKQIASFKSLRNQKAEELGLPPGFLATQDDIAGYILLNEGRLLTSWRKEIFLEN